MFPAKKTTCMKNFRRSTAKIYWMNTTTFNFDPIYTQFDFCVGKVVDLTTLNILRTTRAILMNFCIANTPGCQILISGRIVFCFLQPIFVCEKIRK